MRVSLKVPVHLNEPIRPGSARIYGGATSDYTAEGNLRSVTTGSKLFSSLAGLLCVCVAVDVGRLANDPYQFYYLP